MFDAADLIALPGLVPGASRGVPKRDTARESVPAGERAAGDGGVLNQNLCHVIGACAMGGHNVALAMSNGELCHANMSKPRTAAPEPVPTEDKRWPHWTSWPTRHGKVVSLQFDPAHDALVTIEQATTAAGDQAFLGRYHRQAALSSRERKIDTRDGRGGEASDATAPTTTTPWVGSSVPLATNHATAVAVCASRGWVAVCTGSVVNLWAVARQGLEPQNTGRGAPRPRQAQAPVGFEHALSVDLAELVSTKDGMGKGGGAKHIALYGNLLAVAADQAVFLVHLSFDVKGEVSSRCGSFDAPATGFNAPATPSSRGDPESPNAVSPRSQPPRSSPRDTPTTSSRGGPSAALKSDSKDFPPKSASRGGPSSGRGKGSAGVDEGKGSTGRSSVSAADVEGLRREGVKTNTNTKSKTKPERRDGVVERAISEADDVVVCVLHPGGEEDGREADGSAQPPPLLRGFDDDWEALRARGEHSTEQFENTPLATGLTSIVLSVSGNSTVLDRVGGCDVVLARRVGPAEAVKQLHLLPFYQGDDTLNSDGKQGTAPGESRHTPARACRLVLLTSKGATVCRVCAISRPSPPALSPSFPALGRPPSPGYSERRSPTPPSPSSLSTASAGHGQRKNHLSGQSRPSGGQSRLSSGLGVDSISAGSVAGDHEHLDVFLWQSCRFNQDLLLASITRTFLFVLTVEGVEVWTFPCDQPADKLPDADGRAGKWKCSWPEESSLGGIGTPLSLSSVSPYPAPRPCLLHIQQLEIKGVLPRSPARCMVPLGGAAPGLLLFPSPPANQSASLAFLAQQCRRRLRSHVAADIPAFRKPSPTVNPFALGGSDTNAKLEQDCWQRKFAAWRGGFCGLNLGVGRGGAAETASASPLALFLRLRTPTEAFRLLSAAAERSPRPLSARVSAVFVSAAEGLHGALAAEAAAAWCAAVCPDNGDAGVGLAGRTGALSDDAGGATGEKQAEIEPILAGLANCWRLQRVAARCALLLGRLLLETAAGSIGEQGSISADNNAAAGLAYTRACSWMLASGEPVVKSFALLRDAATRLLAVGGETERTLSGVPSVVLEDDEDEDDHDEEGNSYLTRATATATAEASPPNLEKMLPRAMYESYLLPSLGVGDAAEIHSRGPSVSVRDEEPSPPSLEDALLGLVGYLHGQDMRRLSQRPGLQGLGGGLRRSTLPLSTAVVYADRIPWAACPAALSEALVALDRQDKALALAESTSCNISSGSSGSSSTSLSGRKSPPAVAGVAKRSKPATKARRGAEHRRGSSASMSGSSLDNRGPAVEEWIAVARAVLLGYSELVESGAANAASQGLPGVLAADTRILQLACEIHPSLVVPVANVAPARPGAGPLARDLLAGGRAQPVVAALVNLTSHSGCDGRLGSGKASFGPHKARELLQLTDGCFSSPVDPLHALHIFGIAGRQIAARLDSLRRASLDLPPGAFGFPTEARHFDGNPHEQSGDAVGSRQHGRSETKALSAAAREFLSRRYSSPSSLATGGPSATCRHQERLSQALGAPEAWQASFARNRALNRAILRFLIGAHLDDLRALENSTVGNAKATRSTPTTASGWGGGLSRTATRARNRRDGEGSSWADAIVPLLSGQVSRARGEGPAEEHVEAILCIIREISWRASRADSTLGGGGGRSMSHEEAEEVVTEAKRRLPVSEAASASASAGDLMEDDENSQVDDDTQPWGSGGERVGARRAPWPWGPRAVPASAVGAVLALAAALPPAGKLLAGLDVMLQVGAEVVAAAKSEAAVSAGAVAAASGSAGRGGARGHASPKDASRTGAGETQASVEEVYRAAERALLLYTSEYCGKDSNKWASVMEHVRTTGDGQGGPRGAPTLGGTVSVYAAGNNLVRALLRRCGEELGGKALVRALPESLSLVECLDEVERTLLNGF